LYQEEIRNNMKKEKTQAEKDFENSDEFKKFEEVMKQLMNVSPERLAEIKRTVPYPKEERTQEEYDERISIYPPEE
jgi:hypothetical protein